MRFNDLSSTAREKLDYMIGAYNPYTPNILGVNMDSDNVNVDEINKYCEFKAKSKWQIITNQILYKKEKFRNFLKHIHGGSRLDFKEQQSQDIIEDTLDNELYVYLKFINLAIDQI